MIPTATIKCPNSDRKLNPLSVILLVLMISMVATAALGIFTAYRALHASENALFVLQKQLQINDELIMELAILRAEKANYDTDCNMTDPVVIAPSVHHY